MRTPRAVNSLIDDLFERKYRKVGQEKKRIRIFFSSVFFASISLRRERGLNIGSFTICRVVSHVWIKCLCNILQFFTAVKMINFQMKNCNIFLILLKT